MELRSVELAAARCFESREGAIVLNHLRSITFGRVLGVNATEAELRSLEAQRLFVRQIDGLIGRGKNV